MSDSYSLQELQREVECDLRGLEIPAELQSIETENRRYLKHRVQPRPGAPLVQPEPAPEPYTAKRFMDDALLVVKALAILAAVAIAGGIFLGLLIAKAWRWI